MQGQASMFVDDIDVGTRSDEKVQTINASFKSAQMQTRSSDEIETIDVNAGGSQFTAAFDVA